MTKSGKQASRKIVTSVLPRIFESVFVLAFFTCLRYLALPVFSTNFLGGFLFAILALTLLAVVWSRTDFAPTVATLGGFVFVGMLAYAIFMSAPMFYAKEYRQLLGPQKNGELAKSLPPLDIHQAPLVSYDMAYRAMEKRLADVPALGSQVTLGHPHKQLVGGKLVWVAFLQHRGLFTWYSTRATAGYVKVSAHDVTDVHLVTELNGKPLKMRYLESGYFGDDVERHAYMAGLSNVGLMDFSQELDDEGRPFYVATTYTHRVGFGGADVTGAVTIDVQTGEVHRYSMENVPTWIDLVVPADLITRQVEDFGQYVNGWINPSDKDRLRVSGDVDLVYGENGRAYWIAGLTSVGSDNGLVGFFLIDSRTKEVQRFTVSAVMEDIAKQVAQNVMPEKKYYATNPIPFLVSGTPTYVMALQDSQGVPRAYGMVSMHNHQLVAVADTLAATLRLYQSKLTTGAGANADIGRQANVKTIIGQVVRIAQEIRNNQTMYFVTLAEAGQLREHIFTGSSDLSEELVLTRPNDRVSLSYSESGTRLVGITSFDNLDIAGK